MTVAILRAIPLSVLAAVVGTASIGVSAASGPVQVYYAASLKALNENGIGPQYASQTGYTYEGFPENSGLIVNQIKSNLIKPDVVEFADASLNNQLMGSANGNVVKWYVAFAHTHLVIGFCPNSPLAPTFRRVQDEKYPWWKALLSAGLKFGRTDPNSDPKGYRTVMAFNLAQTSYYKHVKGFPEKFSQEVLGTINNPDPTGSNSASSQVFPESTLVSQVSTCNLDAGIFYLPEARAAKLPYFGLPWKIAFGATKYARLYAKQKYTNNAGLTTKGSPIYYTLTIPSTVQNGAGAVAFAKFVLSNKGEKDEAAIGLQSAAHAIYGEKSAVPPGIK